MLFFAMAALFLAGGNVSTRIRIVWTILRLAFGPSAVTLPNEQLYLANHVLRLPRDTPGDVAEFGCFKGRTSAVLSIACKAAGRRLVLIDTFEGLPGGHDAKETVTGQPFHYAVGTYRGTMDEVRETIRCFGEIDACDFVPGLFGETLPKRLGDRWALIFEDADLPASVRDVLQYAWPSLQPGGRFFCHEAYDPHVVSMFFDDEWWRRVHAQGAPQFVGSGTGLPLAAGIRYGGGALSFFGSFMGYAIRP